MRLSPVVVLVAVVPAVMSHFLLPAPAAAEVVHRHVDVRHALAVLHEWDARRSAAWAGADARSLRSLYVPGSGAGRADVRLLRAYTARGLVVRRIVTQVFGIRVLHRRPGELTVRVLDRVAGGVVDHARQHLALPSTRPVVRRIAFQRAEGAWKVASVRR